MAYALVHNTQYSDGNLVDSVTIPAVAAGNLLVALVFGYYFGGPAPAWNNPIRIQADISGLFTQVPFYSLQGGAAWDWGNPAPGSGCACDILYLISDGGDTTISFDANLGVYLSIYEISGFGSVISVDDFEQTGSAVAVTPVVGPALNGSGLNDILFQVISSFNGNVSAPAPWTEDPNWYSPGNGPVYILDDNGTQAAPTYPDTHGTDKYTIVGVAFAPTVGGPHINSLSPSCGNPGDHITISGSAFGASQGGSTVTFDGIPAAIVSWSDTIIVATVPIGVLTGDVIVHAASDSNALTFTSPPAVSITSLSPAAITYGFGATPVTIHGLGFGASQGTSKVFFNGVDLSATVTSWSATDITVAVPPSIDTGNVVVSLDGTCPSNAKLFTVTTAVNCATDSVRTAVDSNSFTTGIINVLGEGLGQTLSFQTGRATSANDRITCGRSGHYLVGASYQTEANSSVSTRLTSYELWKNGVMIASASGGTDINLELDLTVGDYFQINVVTGGDGLNDIAANLWMVQLIKPLAEMLADPALYETFNNASVDPTFTTLFGFVNFANAIPTHATGANLTTPMAASPGSQGGGLQLPLNDQNAIYLVSGKLGISAGSAVHIGVALGSADVSSPFLIAAGLNAASESSQAYGDVTPPVCNFSNVVRGNYSGGSVPALTFCTTQDTSGGVAFPAPPVHTSATMRVSNLKITKIFPFCITPVPPPDFPSPPGGTSFIPKAQPQPGPIQNIPLNNAPNQVWEVAVKVNGTPVTLQIVLRYNEIARYWSATVKDSEGNILLDSLPFVTGTGISQNLLQQFAYLAIGSATIFNASGTPVDHPNNQDLGKDFLLLWGDTPVN